MPAARQPRPREEGFALLYIFLMAALIAVGMYAVLPRVAFESERDREQLLVDRGEQYKRGIQLYFRKFHTYPAKLEDLENSNGIRFLRQRYKDPVNNSDEWRLIHVGPGGVFTDSLTQKNNKSNANQPFGSVNNSVTELKPIADGAGALANDVNVALRKRPSDSGTGDPNGQTAPGADPNNPPPPGSDPQNLSGQNQAGQNQGAPQNPNANDPNVINPPGSNPVPTPGFGAAPSSASDQIRGLLTTPNAAIARQFGLSNNQPQQPQNALTVNSIDVNSNPNGQSLAGSNTGSSTPQVGGQTVGGGIAGVASKVERKGIKVYNDRHKFNEWEFIYDYGKDVANASGIPQPQNNQSGANPGGTNPGGTNPGGTNPGGTNPGGTNPGSNGAGSTGSGSTPTAPVQLGSPAQ